MFSIQFQYCSLFNITCTHEYFHDKMLHHFSVVHPVTTLEYINELGMIFKINDNGFDILLDNLNTEKITYIFERIKTENIKLRFLLYIKDPFFKNYTDISLDTTKKVYYLSNNELKDKNLGLLHSNETLTTEHLYNIGEDVLGEIDINSPVIIKGQPLALVEINLSDKIISKILNRLHEGKIEQFKYKCNFPSRSVTWKYIIIAENQKKLDGLHIVTEVGKIKFSSAKKDIYKDTDVVVITSYSIHYTKLYDEVPA